MMTVMKRVAVHPSTNNKHQYESIGITAVVIDYIGIVFTLVIIPTTS